MFKKIIVAEDIDSISLGLKSLLEQHNAPEIICTKYCDEAFLKIKKAELDNDPFELLITDLSFKSNHRDVKLTSGERLIEEIKKNEYPIKIIAYSIDERGYNIRYLLDDLDIDAYVSKGRDSTTDLLKAIKTVFNEEKYITPHLSHLKKPAQVNEIDALDLEIIKLLSEGLIQNQIVENFRANGKKVASISSVEKRIIKMKVSLKANNTTHLVSIAKDMGLI